MYGVVWTDVFLAATIAVAAIYTSVVAISLVTSGLLTQWPEMEFNTDCPQFFNNALG